MLSLRQEIGDQRRFIPFVPLSELTSTALADSNRYEPEQELIK
jgi:hypothetical protein